MTTITAKIDNQHFKKQINQVLNTLNNPKPLFIEIAEELHSQTMQIFDAQGQPGWIDLRPRTKKQRAKKGHWPGKILQVSGMLKNSIQTSAGDDYAQIGTYLKYARIQHEGGTIKRNGSVKLKTDAKGKLKRQKDYSNLAVFAKTSHKRAVERAVNYKINIPARPYFPVKNGQIIKPAANAILAIVNKHIVKTR